MANRNRASGGRRQDFGRSDYGRGNSDYGRSNLSAPRSTVSPWQPANLTPLASTEAALTLINNLLQQARPSVPSLLDLPMQQSYNRGYDNRPSGNYDSRGFNSGRMGNNQNFRRGNMGRSTSDGNSRFGQRRTQDRGGKGNNFKSKQESGNKKGAKPAAKTTPKKEIKQEDETQDDTTEDVEQSETVEVKQEPNEDGEGSQNDSEMKGEEEEKGKKAKNKFDEINSSLLICHICNKSMWDGRSFENHINGRAHAMMMDKVAESYALNADMMRQEQRFREAKRVRRTGASPGDFYCAMCDINAEDGPSHRTTPAHRKLKRYLHPPCTICHKEMATRIELDQHKLSYEHLVNVQAEKPIKAEVVTISTLAVEEYFIETEKKRRANKEGEEENKPDDTNVVLDFKEGEITELEKEQVPAYHWERGVGASYVVPFSCFKCTLCDKLLESGEAAEVHARTLKHYNNFVYRLRKIVRQTTSKRTAEEEEQGDSKRTKVQENGEDQDESEQQDEGAAENYDDQEEGAGDEAGEEFAEEEGQNLNEGEENQEQLAPGEKESEWEESWTKDLDEVLNCVKKDNEPDDALAEQDVEMEAPEPEVEPEPQPVKVPEVVDTPTKAKGRPPTATRGRGRGRGRGK